MELQLKRILMSAVEIRTEIDNFLDIIQNRNESFLKVVHSMLNTYVQEQENSILGYDPDGKPLYVNDAKKLFKAELEGVKRGEYMTIEEFEKESETW